MRSPTSAPVATARCRRGARAADYRRSRRSTAAGARLQRARRRAPARGRSAGELLHASERGELGALARRAARATRAPAAAASGSRFETRPDHVDAATRCCACAGSARPRCSSASRALDDALLAREPARPRRRRDARRVARCCAALASSCTRTGWRTCSARRRSDDARISRACSGDPALRPDELKLYPCLLVESAPLRGTTRAASGGPYERDELLALVADCLAATPRWCRVDARGARLLLARHRGGHAASRTCARWQSARSRARRAAPRDPQPRGSRRCLRRRAARALRDAYATSIGEERLPRVGHAGATASPPSCASRSRARPGRAHRHRRAPAPRVLRELHVYGEVARARRARARRRSTPVSARQLVRRAAELAREARYPTLAVISAIGTRD